MTGIRRGLDDLGRFVVPMELRKRYNLSAGDELEIMPTSRGMFIKKVNEAPTVVEWCPHCENEIEMKYEVDKFGFQVHCPFCGKPIMLCDECFERNGNKCDWSKDTGCCMKPKVISLKRKAELFDEMLGYLTEVVSDKQELENVLRNISFTDDEIKIEGVCD